MPTYEVEVNGETYEVEANSLQEASQSIELLTGITSRSADQRGNPVSAFNRGLASTASMAVDGGAALQNVVRNAVGARPIKFPGGTSDSSVREALGRGGVDTRAMPGVAGRGIEYAGAGLPFAVAGPVVGFGQRVLGDAASSILAATGEEIGRRATDSDLGAGVGSLVGGLTPTGFAGGVRATVRGGPASGNEMRTRVNRFDRQGIDPSLSQATGSRALGTIESGLGSTFGGTGAAREFGIRQQDQAQNALINATRGGGMDKSTAGRIIREGVFGEEGYIELARARTDANYKAVWDLADGTQVAQMGKTRDMLASLPAEESLPGLFVTPKMRSIADRVLSGDEVPLADLDETRKWVGHLLGEPVLNPDISRRDLKRLYAALSDDIRTNLATQGPDAVKAFDAAQADFRKHMAYMEGIVNKLSKIDADEKIFEAVAGGRSPDSSVLRQAKSVLNEAEWNTFVRTFTNRLGAIQPSQELPELTFSSESFLTNFNRLRRESPESLDILYGRGQYREDIEQIATTFEDMRRSKVYTNPSQSAGTGIVAASIQSLPMVLASGVVSGAMTSPKVGLATSAASAAAIGGGYYGTRAMSNMMHNQRFVRWLARSTEITPQQYGAHIARLRAMGEGEENAFFNELADVITEQLGNGN